MICDDVSPIFILKVEYVRIINGKKKSTIICLNICISYRREMKYIARKSLYLMLIDKVLWLKIFRLGTWFSTIHSSKLIETVIRPLITHCLWIEPFLQTLLSKAKKLNMDRNSDICWIPNNATKTTEDFKLGFHDRKILFFKLLNQRQDVMFLTSRITVLIAQLKSG